MVWLSGGIASKKPLRENHMKRNIIIGLSVLVLGFVALTGAGHEALEFAAHR